MFENASSYLSSVINLEGSKLYVFIVICILLFVLAVHAYIKYSVKSQVKKFKRINNIQEVEQMQLQAQQQAYIQAHQQAQLHAQEQAHLHAQQAQQPQPQPQPMEDSSFVDPVANSEDDDLGDFGDMGDFDDIESHLDMDIMEQGGVKNNTTLKPSNVMMRDLIDGI
jgi:hypothetical protein